MKIEFTNEIGNHIVVSSSNLTDRVITRILLEMSGPTSKTEWIMTREEGKVLQKVLNAALKEKPEKKENYSKIKYVWLWYNTIECRESDCRLANVCPMHARTWGGECKFEGQWSPNLVKEPMATKINFFCKTKNNPRDILTGVAEKTGMAYQTVDQIPEIVFND